MESALFYDYEKKCLYKGYANTSDCLFSGHDKKGYKTITVQIPPNKSDKIIFSSNLHYQGASFLYAKILINGKHVLNFRDTVALYRLNEYELDTFQVAPGNWDELFDVIIKTYNNSCLISENEIDTYFDELDDIILSDEIMVCRNKTDQKLNKLSGSYLVLLHAIGILSNVIKCKDNSVIGNSEFFENRLLSTCRNFMQRFADCFSTWEMREDDSRLNTFSAGILDIHKYINQYGKPLEFIKFFNPTSERL